MPYCVREASGGALQVGKYTVAPFFLQPRKCGGKEMTIGHRASLRRFCSTIGACDARDFSELHAHASAPCSIVPVERRPVLGEEGDRPPAGQKEREHGGHQELANAASLRIQIGMGQAASTRV